VRNVGFTNIFINIVFEIKFIIKSFPFGITTLTTIVLSQNDIGCNGKNNIKSLKWCKKFDKILDFLQIYCPAQYNFW